MQLHNTPAQPASKSPLIPPESHKAGYNHPKSSCPHPILVNKPSVNIAGERGWVLHRCDEILQRSCWNIHTVLGSKVCAHDGLELVQMEWRHVWPTRWWWWGWWIWGWRWWAFWATHIWLARPGRPHAAPQGTGSVSLWRGNTPENKVACNFVRQLMLELLLQPR